MTKIIPSYRSLVKCPEFLKLLSFPNVLITPHYAFLTEEAMKNIAQTTIDNITAFEMGSPINQVYKN
jgi:D-lactate dehydrogenase